MKEIFLLAHLGISISEIVRRLNLAHIPTPIDYAISKGLEGSYEHGDGSWNSRFVKVYPYQSHIHRRLTAGRKGYFGREDSRSAGIPRYFSLNSAILFPKC